MISTPDQVALRAVFVYPQNDKRALPPTHRLLSDLGHVVTTTDTMDQALQILRDGPVDLLILEQDAVSTQKGDQPVRQRVMDQLDALQPDQRPKEVAIYADRADETASSTRRHTGSPKVHMLFKPLHMHGLLHVLRHLESKVEN